MPETKSCQVIGQACLLSFFQGVLHGSFKVRIAESGCLQHLVFAVAVLCLPTQECMTRHNHNDRVETSPDHQAGKQDGSIDAVCRFRGLPFAVARQSDYQIGPWAVCPG
jgi:hypothetical protein